MRLPKTRRLASNRQFKAVLDRGRRATDGLLVLYMAPNDCGYPRLGVSVGKSLGNAVARNRVKRVLREAFRRSQDRIPPSFDYVLMMSPSLLRRWKRPDVGGKASAALTSQRAQESFLSLVKSTCYANSD